MMNHWPSRAGRRLPWVFCLAIAAAPLVRAAPPAAVTAPASVASAPTAIASPAAGYHLQPGDVLDISVWKEQDLQREVLVRPDNGLNFPLVGEIDTTGMTVERLRTTLTQRLQRFIPDPVVTVAVKTIGGNKIYVLGKVNRPGEYQFASALDVMQALALAGGTTPFAASNDIVILRRHDGQLDSVRFRYGEVEHGKELGQNVVLRSGDTVVVP